jgi:hypothetical protein
MFPQIDNITPLAMTYSNPAYRWQCTVCLAEFARMQDRKRHLVTHLPPGIHCPYPHCSWTSYRAEAFRRHWKDEHSVTHNRIPRKKEFEIYDPLVLVDRITAGTMTIDVAEAIALEQIRAKANQLQKPSLLTRALDHLGNKLRAGSSSQGSLSVTEPNESTKHDRGDQTMHVGRHLVSDGSASSTGASRAEDVSWAEDARRMQDASE